MIGIFETLEKSFEKKDVQVIGLAGVKAYEDAYSILESNYVLATKRGLELLPFLRNTLYDLMIIELCKMNEISFKYEEKLNKALNCHHALFIGDKCQFSLCQVSYKYEFPRSAIYRSNYAANNEQVLFKELEEELDYSRAYAILTHGGVKDALSFARLGLPLKDQRRWNGLQMKVFDRDLIKYTKDDVKKIDVIKPKLKDIKDNMMDKFGISI